MYDSIAPVCFDVLTFFNALLIITHWLLLTPTSASGAPFSPPELHPSLLPSLDSFIPPQPLSRVSGLVCLCLGGGLEGMTWASRWREWQRPIRGQRVLSAASSLVAVEIRHVFISSSHPHQVPSFHFHARGGKQGEGEEEKGLGGVRIRVSVCAFKCVCTCMFACMLCAVNILAIRKDERVDTDSTYLLQSWPKYKCWSRFCVLVEHIPYEWGAWFIHRHVKPT